MCKQRGETQSCVPRLTMESRPSQRLPDPQLLAEAELWRHEKAGNTLRLRTARKPIARQAISLRTERQKRMPLGPRFTRTKFRPLQRESHTTRGIRIST